jgi:hypothetical protein
MGVIALYFIDYVVKVFIVAEMFGDLSLDCYFILFFQPVFFYRVRAQRSRWE